MNLFHPKRDPIKIIAFWLLAFYVATPTVVNAQNEKESGLSNPASVDQQLKNDARTKNPTINWYTLDSLDNKKERLYKKSGFKIGLDYNAQIMAATEAIGNDVGASGVFRVYGKWNFVKPGTKNEGGLIFKVENRHAYTTNALREYGVIDVGYAGLVQSVYNNQGWRATNLYWRQVLGGQDKFVFYAGFVDITDWTDVYVVASPWQSFNNMNFATGSGALGGGYPDGSMGLMLNAWLSENIYVIGGIVDANGDATQFWNGFETFFGQFETVKTIELGYTPNGLSSAFFQNLHVTFWQVDERTEAQTPSGWGVIGSAAWMVGKYLPYLRFGWAKDGFAFYEYSISTGFAYNITGSNNLGIGLNWNKPNPSTFGAELNNQFVSEIFYKWQLTHHSEITPNVQIINKPALNPTANWVALLGLRGRFFL